MAHHTLNLISFPSENPASTSSVYFCSTVQAVKLAVTLGMVAFCRMQSFISDSPSISVELLTISFKPLRFRSSLEDVHDV